MKLSDKDKKTIMTGFIDIFTRISSKEYQKRIWIDGKGPEVDDFDDTVSDFFIECESILENYKDFWITDYQYELLKHFSDIFRIFSNRNNMPEEFIDTPEWEEITLMAKDVLKAFNYKKTRK